jgi:membrane protein DedA with SNARE-associated domain
LLPFSAVSALAETAAFTVIGYVFSESLTEAGETATRVALVVVVLATAVLVIRVRPDRRRAW